MSAGASAASPYLDGFVVTQRLWNKVKESTRGSRRAITGYTLHRADCRYLRANARAVPAPRDPYPHTVDCQYCRPSDPHQHTFTDVGGSLVGTCAACSIKVTGSTLKVAQTSMRREHERVESMRLMAEALARGPVTLVIVPRPDAGRHWRLHRITCPYASRAQPRPAPDVIDPSRVASCAVCQPDGMQSPQELKEPDPPAKDDKKNYDKALPVPGGHSRKQTRGEGGTVRLTCSCGADSGMRGNYNSANAALRRRHETMIRQRQRQASAVE